MGRSLKRLARRALIERQKDVYYHDLMQLRREQQLDNILNQPQTVVNVDDHHHHFDDGHRHHVTAAIDPDCVIVSEDFDMCRDGPSSRDWMLVFMMVGGAIGLTLAICLLAFLAMMAMGIIGGGGATGAGALVR